MLSDLGNDLRRDQSIQREFRGTFRLRGTVRISWQPHAIAGRVQRIRSQQTLA